MCSNMPNLLESKVVQKVDKRKWKLRGKIGAEPHSVSVI